jgi:hypothetical protein
LTISDRIRPTHSHLACRLRKSDPAIDPYRPPRPGLKNESEYSDPIHFVPAMPIRLSHFLMSLRSYRIPDLLIRQAEEVACREATTVDSIISIALSSRGRDRSSGRSGE